LNNVNDLFIDKNVNLDFLFTAHDTFLW